MSYVLENKICLCNFLYPRVSKTSTTNRTSLIPRFHCGKQALVSAHHKYPEGKSRRSNQTCFPLMRAAASIPVVYLDAERKKENLRGEKSRGV